MSRTLVAVSAAALLLCSAAPIAHAQPAPSSCDYELTAPTVVNVSGTDVVTATVSPRACDGATTYQTVACLQMAGGTGPGQCARGNGILPAQVFFQPYRPGATYTATGRGCSSAGNPPQTSCHETGPLTATL